MLLQATITVFLISVLTLGYYYNFHLCLRPLWRSCPRRWWRELPALLRCAQQELGLVDPEPSSEDDEDLPPIAPFEERGQRKSKGVSYFDGGVVNPGAVPVGVSYCITSLKNIDVKEETFQVTINLNLRYRIKDSEYEEYRRIKKDGTIDDVQKVLVDNENIQTRPPILEVMNAQEVVFRHWRIYDLARCHNPVNYREEQEWSWYVMFYVAVTATCKEEFDLHHFPFTRQAIQMQIQPKQHLKRLALVPWEEPSFQPIRVMRTPKDAGGAEAVQEELQPRFNSMNCPGTLGTWEVENHHVAFPSKQYLAPLPSLNQYSKAVITIQIRQCAAYFVWNCAPLIFMPVLAVIAIFEEPNQVANRSSIVLALLVTMAAYKVSIQDWMPQKHYLTLLDKYILSGFVLILLIGMLVGFSAFVVEVSADVTFFCKVVERIIAVGVTMVWVSGHFALALNWMQDRLECSYEDILRSENQKMKELAKQVRASNEKLSSQMKKHREAVIEYMDAPDMPDEDERSLLRRSSGLNPEVPDEPGFDERPRRNLQSAMQRQESVARLVRTLTPQVKQLLRPELKETMMQQDVSSRERMRHGSADSSPTGSVSMQPDLSRQRSRVRFEGFEGTAAAVASSSPADCVPDFSSEPRGSVSERVIRTASDPVNGLLLERQCQ